MSAQTGVMPPSGPASQRLVDRARYRVERLKSAPNPIWMRELRQSARLARTPIILTVVTVLMTLLMASIGGIMAASSSPAATGVTLFHTFFSLAYFVVALVGPAVAANSIASEREGRTWEAVILTGVRPGEVARGKFLAAYTAIGMYIVMLAPVGALPFLFGGVTATEVIVAFAFLFLIALLGVAFGLAISSKMGNLRGAIVVTLLLAFPISIAAFLALGMGLSTAAHEAWPGVLRGAPVWLPTAYQRVPFGLEYVVYLFVIPLAAVVLPAWFLYEVTIANLTSMTDDRSTGLKRWFLVALPVVALGTALPHLALQPSDLDKMGVLALAILALFLGFCVFLFQGDPIGPSRRVIVHWDRARAGRFRRFLGPGVMRSATLLFGGGLAAFALVTVVSLVAIQAGGAADRATQAARVASFAHYGAAFHVFLVGFGAWARARASTPVVARVMSFAILFGILVGPWIVAAITGVLVEPMGSRDALVVAAPSPIFAFVVVASFHRSDSGAVVMAGFIASIAWAVLGLVLLAAAKRRTGAIIRRHEAVLAEADRMLAEEDAAAEAAAAAAASGAAPGAEPAAASNEAPPAPADAGPAPAAPA